MASFIWVSYGVLMLAALVLSVMNSLATTVSRVTLPQLFYVLYLLLVEVASIVTHSVIGALVCMISVVGIVIWMGPRQLEDEDIKKELEAELASYRKTYKEMPDNSASLYFIGEVFAKVGAMSLALKYYKQSYAIYADPKLYDKILGLEKDPIGGVNADSAPIKALRACPECETLRYRMDYDCGRCGWGFYPSRRIWLAAFFNRLYDAGGLNGITVAGLALLPYLFVCGHWAYFFLWAIWSFAWGNWRIQTE